mmetsp:Transcript_32408/g.58868  ORF Transcript_32408/g.58868 Transcript_32408/m.58868 type:complete len:97 (+) Transcript_32408:75-365(+)
MLSSKCFVPPSIVRPQKRTINIVAKSGCKEGGCRINRLVKLDEGKVVDFVAAKDLSQPKVAFCRCWLSKTFPHCDGSHAKHNKDNGDNVGPLVITK